MRIYDHTKCQFYLGFPSTNELKRFIVQLRKSFYPSDRALLAQYEHLIKLRKNAK